MTEVWISEMAPVPLAAHGLGTGCLRKKHGREILHTIPSCALSFIPCTNIIYSKNKYNLTFKKLQNTNGNKKSGISGGG